MKFWEPLKSVLSATEKEAVPSSYLPPLVLRNLLPPPLAPAQSPLPITILIPPSCAQLSLHLEISMS